MAKSIIEKTGAQVIGNSYVIDYSSLETLENFTNLTILHVKNYRLETEEKVVLTVNTNYTIDESNLEITIDSDTVTIDSSADRIAILRTTDVNNPAVSFTDTAILTDTDLNTSVKQAVFRLQELNEQSSDGYDTTSLALEGKVNSNTNTVNAVTASGWVVNNRLADSSITTDKIENGTIQGNDLNLSSVKAALGDLLYPIGSIYCNYSNSTDPGSLLGFGSWTRIEGKVVVGYHAGDSDFGSLGEDPSYGEKKHQLTVAELASHTHVIGVSEISDRDDDENKHTAVMRGTSNTEATGGDVPHNNLQPYAVVNMWRRTA
tara:strand:- start:2927 stop:3880 length:954 start_codon:yes stop_codon:yes gene_type:complete